MCSQGTALSCLPLKMKRKGIFSAPVIFEMILAGKSESSVPMRRVILPLCNAIIPIPSSQAGRRLRRFCLLPTRYARRELILEVVATQKEIWLLELM